MDMKLEDYFAQHVFGIIYWVSTNGEIMTNTPRKLYPNQGVNHRVLWLWYVEYLQMYVTTETF